MHRQPGPEPIDQRIAQFDWRLYGNGAGLGQQPSAQLPGALDGGTQLLAILGGFQLHVG